MTVEEVRIKYPEAKDYTDEQIKTCFNSADILARMFVSYLEKKLTIDTYGKNDQ